MSYNSSLLGYGVTFTADEIAALTGPGSGPDAYTINGNGTYSLDGTTYDGAESDFGTSGNAVGSFTVVGWNGAIVTWSQTTDGGATTTGFGGEVIGWTANAILVEVISGFVPINQSAGTFAGTLDPQEAYWLSATDISFEANGGNGPPGYNENTGVFSPPITFGTTGTQPSFQFNTSLLNGATLAANKVAALVGIPKNANDSYTESGAEYGGALSDGYNGNLPDASQIASVSVTAYNPTAAPNIVEVALNNEGGGSGGTVYGQIVGWDGNDVLLDEIDNFTTISQSAGTFGGTLDPSNFLWLSTEDISATSSVAQGLATSPVTFAYDAGSPEPDFVTPLCFLAGTTIQTPRGEVRVERLSVGDSVTLAGGGTAPIVWIGKGKVLATRGRRSAATPVILRKSALADNVPNRDLRVTKGHAFYIDDVLIPAEFLVNHRTILWDDRAQEVELYHIELASHDVLVANGAPAESYRDDGNRWLFQNANTGWDQPPKPPCAPVLTGGPVVDAVWRRLLDRAGPRPRLPLTDDPDLHITMDGRRLDPIERKGNTVLFRLPPSPGDVRIVSRAAAPAELGLARDSRILGVALSSLVVLWGSKFRLVDAADPRLACGFHAFEPDDAIRWTNGDALLPPVLFQDTAGAVEVLLRLGGATQFLDDGLRKLAA